MTDKTTTTGRTESMTASAAAKAAEYRRYRDGILDGTITPPLDPTRRRR